LSASTFCLEASLGLEDLETANGSSGASLKNASDGSCGRVYSLTHLMYSLLPDARVYTTILKFGTDGLFGLFEATSSINSATLSSEVTPMILNVVPASTNFPLSRYYLFSPSVIVSTSATNVF